jgi:long-chain acyl-CoA synthetase
VEQVKKFKILPKELVPEDGDTTPTRKVKRAHAYKLFGQIVEEMYGEDTVQEAVGIGSTG